MDSEPERPDDKQKADFGALLAKLTPPPPPGVCPYCYTFNILDHMFCQRKLFEGSAHCYWHTINIDKYESSAVERYFGSGKTLIKAIEEEISSGRTMAGAYLADAPLGGNMVRRGSILESGQFVQADLSRARISYSNSRRCNFVWANLEEAFLSDCDLANCNFYGARLFRTKFRNNSFDGVQGLERKSFKGLKWGWYAVYYMLEDHPEQCGPVYRSLALHFANRLLFDDASWAAYRAAIMHHRILTKGLKPLNVAIGEVMDGVYVPSARSELTRGKFGALWCVAFLRWLRSLTFLILVGYGEKPGRVMLNAAAVILAYTCLYHWLSAITESTWSASLYFSIVTFSTVGYGEIIPKPPFRLIAASEGLVGIFFTGLFLFALARRSVARA